MLKLRRLIVYQGLFACASLTYLGLSYWHLEETGEALSAAAIGPSISLFVAYLFTLALPHFGFERLYRIAMVFALVFFGGGGVIGNIMRYMDSGLEYYASLFAFVIAVTINGLGSLLNLIALFGWYSRR